jgi:hypothetical protein
MLTDSRAATIQAIKDLEIPTVPLSELAQTQAPRISEFCKGRAMNREVELRIIAAVAKVKKCWEGYGGIRIPITSSDGSFDGFNAALSNLEYQERLSAGINNLDIIKALRDELYRRELLAASEPIAATPAV